MEETKQKSPWRQSLLEMPVLPIAPTAFTVQPVRSPSSKPPSTIASSGRLSAPLEDSAKDEDEDDDDGRSVLLLLLLLLKSQLDDDDDPLEPAEDGRADDSTLLPLLLSALMDDAPLEPENRDREDDDRLLLSALEGNGKDDDDDDDDDDGRPVLLLTGTQGMSPCAATVPSGSSCSETSSSRIGPAAGALLPSIWKVTKPKLSAVNCTQNSPQFSSPAE